MTARRRAEVAVRLEVPRLEPDDAFVEQLAIAASTSQPSAAARRPLQGLRVGLATAGVVGLTVGGAWAAGNLVERADQAPGRSPATQSNAPISPESSPSAETPTTPAVPPREKKAKENQGQRPDTRPGHGNGRDHERGRPDQPGDRGKHLGRPDEHPGKGDGPGRDHGKGKPPGVPAHGEPGKGADQRDDRADPGGPKGSGGGRRADSPR
jgi:hypothetical protein